MTGSDRKLDDEWGKRTADHQERQFLEGPRSRLAELWRATRIFGEFIRGFRALHFMPPCVTVFGSARFGEDNRHYQQARALGSAIAKSGLTVMTGGGPGIMEAANRGAHETGGFSVGCNITLPHEQHPNPYLDRFVEFRYFVIMPGGFGTMDELFEVSTLIQTGKVHDFPVVLMGTDYWQPMLEFLRNTMVREGTIDEQDIDRLLITDDVDLCADTLRRTATERFGVTLTPPRRPRRILGEPKVPETKVSS
jgi:uncharacterized protein (TIGR00730 family)